MSRSHIGDLLMQIQGAFLEMPELALTLRAAQRCFGLDEASCRELLGALVDAGVLMRTDDGAYERFFPGLALSTVVSEANRSTKGDGRAVANRAA